MQLTGKQIIEAGIITNYSDDAIQQQGVDVRVAAISEVIGGGEIPAFGKTKKSMTTPCRPVAYDAREVYVLSPGYYEVTLMESCKLPNNVELDYKSRSSLVRCGATVHSGQFDAGFETEQMGCFMDVRRPIRIEVGARIAQAVVNETYPVAEENLYNGQWQGDKQRNEDPEPEVETPSEDENLSPESEEKDKPKRRPRKKKEESEVETPSKSAE